ncbi:MAG: MBOAT family protein [Lachnospiraceae bacterium]|nr:MBOAT family protein [Lachnospiraceae bacterium]
MSFTSIYFLAGFPAGVLVYYVIPDKLKRIWLLLVSYLFVLLAMPQALVWLSGITALSYLLGNVLLRKRSKFIFGTSICILCFLLVFLRRIGIYQVGLLAPIGISFYMMQAISYLIEIYNGKIIIAPQLWDYALYISFFPKFLSGPIEKPNDFIAQIQLQKSIPDYTICKRALLRMFWGYFEKIVVADHAAIIVNIIFEEYTDHTGFILICGAVLYGIQLYADFDGYSNIALGAAEFLGYHITRNFERPYFSRSIGEFWRRWHISLSTWLRDYIYIPLGGNRKGKRRTYANLLITFVISGIWHGTGAKFLFWGILHGIYQVMSKMTLKFRNAMQTRLRINTRCYSYFLFQNILTFMMVDFAWIFFRAEGLRQGISYVGHMCKNFALTQIVSTSIYALNVNSVIITTMILGIAVIIMKDILVECRIDVLTLLGRQNLLFRWLIYAVLCIWVVIAYIQLIGLDASQFIYGQF